MFENKSTSIDFLFPNGNAKAVPPTNTKNLNILFASKTLIIPVCKIRLFEIVTSKIYFRNRKANRTKT